MKTAMIAARLTRRNDGEWIKGAEPTVKAGPAPLVRVFRQPIDSRRDARRIADIARLSPGVLRPPLHRPIAG